MWICFNNYCFFLCMLINLWLLHACFARLFQVVWHELFSVVRGFDCYCWFKERQYVLKPFPLNIPVTFMLRCHCTVLQTKAFQQLRGLLTIVRKTPNLKLWVNLPHQVQLALCSLITLLWTKLTFSILQMVMKFQVRLLCLTLVQNLHQHLRACWWIAKAYRQQFEQYLHLWHRPINQ